MKRRLPLVLLLVLALAVLWSLQTNTPGTTKSEKLLTEPGVQAGLKVYIDPETKLPVEEPIEPSVENPDVADDLNFSSEGLTIEKSPVSGEMVDLQGRFRHHYAAGVDDEGRTTVSCDIHKSTRDGDSNGEEE